MPKWFLLLLLLKMLRVVAQTLNWTNSFTFVKGGDSRCKGPMEPVSQPAPQQDCWAVVHHTELQDRVHTVSSFIFTPESLRSAMMFTLTIPLGEDRDRSWVRPWLSGVPKTGHGLPLPFPEGGGAEWQPGLLRLTHPPNHIRKIFFSRKMKLIKGARNWRSI